MEMREHRTTPGDQRADVLGVPVDALTVDALHERLRAFVREGRRATVLHANVHAVNLAHRHAWFARLLRDADVVFCDGYGVQLGARLLGQHLPARITYADWMWQLADWCAREQVSLFFVGAAPGVADAAAERLVARFPRLVIAGAHHGFFDKTPDSAESRAVIESINAARPDIVIVAFGMPLQERWVADHRHRMLAPAVLTGGAVFDYVSGRVRRAPSWMTDNGFEWLGRLMIEPARLAGRYLIGNPVFMARVLWQRLRVGRRVR